MSTSAVGVAAGAHDELRLADRPDIQRMLTKNGDLHEHVRFSGIVTKVSHASEPAPAVQSC